MLDAGSSNGRTLVFEAKNHSSNLCPAIFNTLPVIHE